jgi:MjaI restriction endonuclease
MSNSNSEQVGKSFGKKEKVLNYTSNTYQLTRPKKVGAVMDMIRICQPATFEEWEFFYFEKAHTETKTPVKVTKEILDELGERLYEKITEVVIPEWNEAFKNITLQDCIDYIYDVTLVRTYNGFLLEKSVINDVLVKQFPDVEFIETDSELDHSGDIDYVGKVGKYVFGIQIKPTTSRANFGNYSISDRMRANFQEFEEQYGGKVFIIFSAKVGNKKEILNKEVLDEMREEIKRLKKLQNSNAG